MKNYATISAWTFAAAFLGATLMGFIANPLVGENAFFVTNTAHSLVHLATAAGFAVVAQMGEKASIRFMQVFGVVYLLTAALGFASLGARPEGYLLELIRINRPDNFLHLGLGIAITSAGWLLQNHRYHAAVVRRV